MKHLVWSLFCFTLLVTLVEGHGRLLQPPARSSLWRNGYDAPANYDDNQLFCGGRSHQISLGGRCGICGDPYDEPVPRTNEIGGPIYRGFLVANYSAGAEIDVNVDLTANHKGYFQFRICPVPGFNTEATQECLDRHVLTVAGTGQTEYPVRPWYRQVWVRLQLPTDLTCQHCVLQWRYRAGNSWGNCEDGSQAAGCGPQEEFYGCADVTIHHDRDVATYEDQRTVAGRPAADTTVRPTTSARRPVRPAPPVPSGSAGRRPNTRQPAQPPARSGACVSVGLWAGVPGMDAWCQLNCGHSPPYCPASHCSCLDEQQAARSGKRP